MFELYHFQYLASRLRDLDWTVELDTFTKNTVMLKKDNKNLFDDEEINGGELLL